MVLFKELRHHPPQEFPYFFAPSASSPLPGSLSHGGGSSEVGEEFEAEAHHKVPDVSGHLRAGDEHPPDENDQQGVEGVADVP